MSTDIDKRYEREFGQGTFLGKNGRNFFQKPLAQQVIEMGWSHACPVIDEVMAEFGEEWTVQRYAECNFVFGLIAEAARDLNPSLHAQLTSPVDRLPDEPVGVFNINTPESHKVRMAPLSTPWGYALPRVAIEQMGRGEGHKDRTPERFLLALNLIEDTVKESSNPIELAVKLAEKVCENDADPKEVLSHLLPAGVMKEENCSQMFQKTVDYIRSNAPILSQAYDSMPLAEKQQLGMLAL